MSVERYQVVVVGAGLVGAAAALALARRGVRVALVERQPPPAPEANWDTRIYAISPASERFLRALGVWDRLDRNRTEPVYRMDVAGDAASALRLDAYEAGVSHLATIVESGRLQHALWQALEDDGTATLSWPRTIDSLERKATHTAIRLAEGDVLEAELVVGADGGQSSIREWAGLLAQHVPYGQHGVVANFESERPHGGTAFQWFSEGRVLAWLPLPGNRMSMVWSTDSTHAASLQALDAQALARTVADAGKGRLGELTLLTPAAAFPLHLLRVPTAVAPGVALIGDAAHGVHPLAGQGVNLGFGDAEALADVLGRAHRRARCGDARLLAHYVRERAEPVQRMQAGTHGLYHLFADDRARWLRNTGLTAFDRLPPLKAALVREAMS